MPVDFAIKPEGPKPNEKIDKPEAAAKPAEKQPKEDKKEVAANAIE